MSGGGASSEAGRRLAVIDVGTNTVRLLVVESRGDSIDVLDEFGEVTRLGSSLSRTNRIEPEDAERTLRCLGECMQRARAVGSAEIEIAGTEVFRSALNGPETAGEFSKRLGRAVRILSPDEEAEASYLGVVGWEESLGPDRVLVLDVGGGSSELVLGEGVTLLRASSIAIGALRATESWLAGDPPRPDQIETAGREIGRALNALDSFALSGRGRVSAFAVGGSACAIGAWVHRVRPYSAESVHGRTVSYEDLEKIVAEWSTMTLAQRMAQGGMSEGRARVVLGGALIFAGLFRVLKLTEMRVSVHGLRHGLALKRLLQG